MHKQGGISGGAVSAVGQVNCLKMLRRLISSRLHTRTPHMAEHPLYTSTTFAGSVHGALECQHVTRKYTANMLQDYPLATCCKGLAQHRASKAPRGRGVGGAPCAMRHVRQWWPSPCACAAPTAATRSGIAGPGLPTRPGMPGSASCPAARCGAHLSLAAHGAACI